MTDSHNGVAAAASAAPTREAAGSPQRHHHAQGGRHQLNRRGKKVLPVSCRGPNSRSGRSHLLPIATLCIVCAYAYTSLRTLTFMKSTTSSNESAEEQEEEILTSHLRSMMNTVPNDGGDGGGSMGNATKRDVEEEGGGWTHGDVVHVVSTRFMQRQSKLLHLGHARLELFRTFCLPTMVQQTNQNFLWIIRTDPKLNANLTSQMVDLLRPYPNYVLVKSNSNPEGFRKDESVEDALKVKNVLSGDVSLVRRYHAAAQTRAVLETRLDADDGLNAGLIEYLQSSARLSLVPPPHHNNTNTDAANGARPPPRWMVWCAADHFEWHAIGLPTSGGAPDDDAGMVRPYREEICITPGLTKGYAADVTISSLPSGSHHRLHTKAAGCRPGGTACVRRFPGHGLLRPSVVRARTPTSAGMNNVLGMAREAEDFATEEMQSQLWEEMSDKFNITLSDGRRARRHVLDNLPLIAADNLEGQCTKGHSCKLSSKAKLQELMKLGTMKVDADT